MELVFDAIGFILTGIGYLFAAIIVLVVMAIFFGKKVIWKFKAEGYSEAFEGNKVRVKLKNLDKKGQTLEIRGKTKSEWRTDNLDVLLNGFRIASVSPDQIKNGSAELNINIEEPSRGDTLSLLINDREVYSEKIV